MIFRCGTTHCLLYRRASLRYQQGCTSCLTIDQFLCHCDSQYVGRTSQRLLDRIKQHVPKSIRSCSSTQKRLLLAGRFKFSTQTNNQSFAFDSAVELHLLINPVFAQHYHDIRSFILAQDRYLFHLSAFEATFITTFNHILCQQK